MQVLPSYLCDDANNVTYNHAMSNADEVTVAVSASTDVK